MTENRNRGNKYWRRIIETVLRSQRKARATLPDWWVRRNYHLPRNAPSSLIDGYREMLRAHRQLRELQREHNRTE